MNSDYLLNFVIPQGPTGPTETYKSVILYFK